MKVSATRTNTVARKVRDLAAPICHTNGCKVFDVEFIEAGDRSVLRVFIDRTDGVGIEDCRHVSRELGVALDVEDLIRTRYLLEVSSPGLDRPLRDEEDFRAHVGRRVRIRTTEALENRRNFVGKLLGYREGAAVLEMPEGPMEIPYEKMEKANLEIED